MDIGSILLGIVLLGVAGCSDTLGQKGEGPVPVEDAAGDNDGAGDDGAGVGGTGPDGDALADGAGTDGNVACDPAVRDCDTTCACDGSALEDDCVEHQCAEGCTEPQGYWKNADVWPVTELVLGGRTYDAPTLVAFLDLPTEGDASITLGTHLIAARLNLVANVVDAELMDEVDAADAWIAAHDDGDGLPFGMRPSDARAADAMALARELADFNGGVVGPGVCSAEETPPEDEGADPTDTAATP